MINYIDEAVYRRWGICIQVLLAALEEAAVEAAVRLKRPDKKAEKAALQSEQQALQKQLQAAVDAAAELSLAVPLLVQRVCHKLLRLLQCQIGQYKCVPKLQIDLARAQSSKGSWPGMASSVCLNLHITQHMYKWCRPSEGM